MIKPGSYVRVDYLGDKVPGQILRTTIVHELFNGKCQVISTIDVHSIGQPLWNKQIVKGWLNCEEHNPCLQVSTPAPGVETDTTSIPDTAPSDTKSTPDSAVPTSATNDT